METLRRQTALVGSAEHSRLGLEDGGHNRMAVPGHREWDESERDKGNCLCGHPSLN